MRTPTAGIAILLLLSGLAWWRLPEPSRVEPIDTLVPDNVLALILVREVPDSLDQLSNTQLLQWLTPHLRQAQEKISEEELDEYLNLFRENLIQASGVIHSLQRKESGAFRVDFTLFLYPKQGRGWGLSRYLAEWGRRIFGADVQTLEEGPVRIVRGSEEGQILYLVQMPGYLIVSNTGTGWEQTLETLREERPSLAENADFRRVRHALQESEIFVYFRGPRVLPILPEFAYGINLEGKNSTDRYFALED